MGSKPATWRPRLTLANLFLLVATAATLIASYQARRELEEVRASLPALRRLARELRVDDSSRIAVIQRLPMLPNELIYDIHIPEPQDDLIGHRLALVLDNIVSEGASPVRFPEPQKTRPIAPGRHSLEIRHISPVHKSAPDTPHRFEIVLDGEVVMHALRAQSSIPTTDWSSTGGSFEITHDFAPQERVELHRRRFNKKTATGSTSPPSDEPAQGILLWIEPRAS